jgi:hypothetical protein
MLGGLGSLLITVLILGLIIGVLVWIIGLIPMPPIFKTVCYVIIGVIILIWLLSLLPGAHFGSYPYGRMVP